MLVHACKMWRSQKSVKASCSIRWGVADAHRPRRLLKPLVLRGGVAYDLASKIWIVLPSPGLCPGLLGSKPATRVKFLQISAIKGLEHKSSEF